MNTVTGDLAGPPDGHRELREALGAYVLGQLSAEETRAVRAHLQTCPTCPGELAELLPVAAALRLADPERVTAAASPPPQLGDRIVARARTEERGRRPVRVLRRTAPYLGAAAAACVGAVLALGVSAAQQDPGPPTEDVAVVALVPGVEADADLVAHTWGTEIQLVARGLDAGSYRVSVRDEAGREVAAGTFLGTGDAPLRCSLNAATLRPDAQAFTVTDGTGRVVLQSDL